MFNELIIELIFVGLVGLINFWVGYRLGKHNQREQGEPATKSIKKASAMDYDVIPMEDVKSE